VTRAGAWQRLAFAAATIATTALLLYTVGAPSQMS
jgi:hypothetical protein